MMGMAAALSRMLPLVAALLLGCLTAGCWPESEKPLSQCVTDIFPVV